MCFFHYDRLYLTAMRVNANSDRLQTVMEDGDLQWKIDRPRANKGQPTARPVKEKTTRCKQFFIYFSLKLEL